MVVNDDLRSVVSLHNIYCDKIDFARTEVPISEENLKCRFVKSYHFNDEHTTCRVSLGCEFTEDGSEDIHFKVIVTGHFSCEDPDQNRRDVLLKKNTLAILFPYLRTQVSVITMQPGMNPIIIPPINIEAVFDQAENV